MIEPAVNDRKARLRSYLVAFGITALMFATAFYASDYFNARRVADIRATQDDISTDILSIETQFDLLQEHSCADIAENTILPRAVTSLGSQLSYLENQGGNTQEVTRLKRLYSLLEIKDYLLMKQLTAKCGLKPIFILYFYSNARCDDCRDQGYVLTGLADKYPTLRIYSFDYDLDVSALQTLIDIDHIQNTLPALLVNGTAHYGLQKIPDIEKILPQLKTMKTSATSTKAR
ncbi:hypothetical protein HY968_04185 [Candidatus Kaiserbacteria bacterium]|nr:hypothetical protein [Candidatus Kaiserbacteria bacterium]